MKIGQLVMRKQLQRRSRNGVDIDMDENQAQRVG